MLLLADRQDGRYATCSKKNFITHYLLTYLLTDLTLYRIRLT